MKEVLDKHPQVVANAEEAIRRAGIKPLKMSIRAELTAAGFRLWACPARNILTARNGAAHSKTRVCKHPGYAGRQWTRLSILYRFGKNGS